MVDGAGDAALSVGDGAGDGAVGCGLVVEDGLPAGDGLVAGDGAADGDAAGVLACDGAAVGTGTGIGSVAPAAELGNKVMTGSPGAGLCLAPAGAGAEAGEAATLMSGRSRLAGPTAALLAVVAGEPMELVGPAR